MENRILKYRFTNLLKNGVKVFAILLVCLNFSPLNSQSFIDLGNGKYQFESVLPEWDLHFWLFDDGYHSFSHEPIHYYGQNAMPSIPVLFHAKPYEDNDVDDINLGTVTNGGENFNLNGSNFQNQIEIKRSWNLVNSKDNYFILMFENTKYDEPVSGCVEFHFDENESFITETDILDHYNNNWVGQKTKEPSEYEDYTDKFTWNFHNLLPNEQRFIYIPAVCLGAPMTKVYTRGVLKVDDCDRTIPEEGENDGSNNGVFFSPIYTLRSVVSNHPHDPNFISSDPTCWTSAEAFSQTIRYRLQFQNEGSEPVENVFANLISNVPFGSVKLVDYSNGCFLNWDPYKVNVEFNNIGLKGLNEDPTPKYEETIGWIEFDVCFNVASIEHLNLDCIEIEAEVKFDSQPSIFAYNNVCKEDHCETNYGEFETGICIPEPHNQGSIPHGETGNKVSTSTNNKNDFDITIFPNPANNFIKIDYHKDLEVSEITIFNLIGEIVVDNKMKLNENIIDISNLKSGLYYLKIHIDGILQSKSFIKL